MSKFQAYDNSTGIWPHPLTSDNYGFLCNTHMNDAEILLTGYRFGIFPWDNFGSLGSFFFPKKRYVIRPEEIKIPKSIKSYFNQEKFAITIDEYFPEVVYSCRYVKRKRENSTWITDQFQEVYGKLHEMGYAHSVEVWKGDYLVGGLYGVAIGKIFTGESMFSLEDNAARFALISLAKILKEWGFHYIDCQVYNHFLSSFGGNEIDGEDFFKIMKQNYFEEDKAGKWVIS